MSKRSKEYYCVNPVFDEDGNLVANTNDKLKVKKGMLCKRGTFVCARDSECFIDNVIVLD